MPGSIKISALTRINDTDLSKDDQLVINDDNRSDGQVITRRTDLTGVLNYLSAQEITFSNNVNFSGQVTYLNDVSFNGDVNLTLDELSNVQTGSKTDESVLVWDANAGSTGAWVAKSVTIDTYTKAEIDSKLSEVVVISPVQPPSPYQGQLWLNTTDGMLYVYNGGSFLNTRPSGLLISDGLSTRGILPPPVSTVPTSTYSEGTAGEFVADEDYLYFCISNDTWIKTRIVPFDENSPVIETE